MDLLKEREINLIKLGITSSTRAEVATIVKVIQSFPNSNMVIYTDSNPVIKEFKLICETNWNKI